MLLPESTENKVIEAKGRLEAQEVADEGGEMRKITKARNNGRSTGRSMVKRYPVIALILAVVLPLGLHYLSVYAFGYIPVLPKGMFSLTWLPIIPLGFLGFTLGLYPIIRVIGADNSRTEELETQLADVLRKTGTDLAGGMINLPQAIMRTIKESPQPVKMELEQVYNEMEAAGAEFSEAIMSIDRNNDSKVASRVCSTLSASYEKLEEEEMKIALSQTAEMVQQDKSLKRKKETAFSSPVMNLTILIMGFLPFMALMVAYFVGRMVPYVEQMASMSETFEDVGVQGIKSEYISPQKVERALAVLPQFIFLEGTTVSLSLGLLIQRDIIWFVKRYAMFCIMLTVIGIVLM